MKKFIAMLMVLAMVLAIAPAAALAEEPVTVHVFHYMVEGNKAAGLEAIEAKFSEKYPNVTFENTAYSQGTDYFAQLQTAIASGDMPEVMMGNPGLYSDLIDNGFVMDLTDNEVIKSLGLTQADMGDVSYEGVWRAFPVDFKTWGVYYNVDLFEANGFEVPTTATEMLELCKALDAKGIQPWANFFNDGATPDIEMRPIVWTQAKLNGDLDMFEKLMSGEKKVADYPYFADALKMFGDRVTGWAGANAMTNGQAQANEEFLTGKAAMLFQGTWNYGSIEAGKSDDFNYGFFLVPTDDDPATGEVLNVQVDQAFMVNPEAENADWGVKFMEFWLTDCMGMWSDYASQPCITGATTENTSEFLKTILDAKANGASAGYGEFTKPFSSAFTTAYRTALKAYASWCCTGVATDGVDSVESCIEYMQKLFDEEIKQAGM